MDREGSKCEEERVCAATQMPFEIWVAFAAGVTRTDVTAELSPLHNADIINQHEVDTIWAERVAANPKLFNGSKFRLADIDFAPGTSGTVSLKLGLTDYKSFLGSNFSPNAADLTAKGIAAKQPRRHLADPLGVGGVTVTSDGYVVLIRRSKSVGEAAGMLDVPGGHPEPTVSCVRWVEWVA